MSSGIATRLARMRGLKFVSLTAALDVSGERPMPPAAQSLFLPKGYCYGAFTSYPSEFDIPIISQCQSTLIVRDPRDLLVSLYYSMRYSHTEPREGASNSEIFERARRFAKDRDIDSYVWNAIPTIHAMFSSYARILDLPSLKIFRYENVIYRKREWVAEICDHFRWSVKKSARDSIADAFDVFPEQEERNSHVRQVHPGNYKNQLQDATIRRIEAAFAEEMRIFGYPAHVADIPTGKAQASE
jgi:hypothetical protein